MPRPRNDVLSTTRSAVTAQYYLMAPETMVANTLPHLPPYSAVVLAAPQGTPARFGQYLLTLDPDQGSRAELGAGFENFLFVLEGALRVTSGNEKWSLAGEGYLFLPQGRRFAILAEQATRLLWIKKPYSRVEGADDPPVVVGSLADVIDIFDDTIQGTYGQLLPPDERFDMAMNVMRFEAGARFQMVETHHQEHGLYMLAGAGLYHLAGDHLEVERDDFVYMAPYCPQAFTATTDATAYLLYKDVNRDGF